jgi:hypothetical protein
MATSKREQILNAIKTAHDSITTLNGYNNTLARNTSAYLMPSDLSHADTPAVCLLPGISQITPLTNCEYTSGGSSNNLDGWAISAIGYVKKTTPEQLKTDTENLIADMIKAVQVDPKLGLSDFVRNTTLTSIISYPDYQDNLGSVQLIWVVKYDFEKENP